MRPPSAFPDFRTYLRFLIMTNPALVEKGRKDAQRIRTEVLASLRPRSHKRLRKAEALSALLKLTEQLEHRLSILIKQNSVQWWLAIGRKLPLELFFPRFNMFSSLTQARWTFDRAIIKFGRKKASDIDYSANNTSAPIFSFDDLERFFCALFLAWHIYGLATCYRRVSKGAAFGTSPEECVAPPSLNRLMGLFDQRRELNGDLLAVFGSSSHFPMRETDSGPAKEPFVLLSIAHNDYLSALTTPTSFEWGYLSLGRVQDAVRFWTDLGIRLRGFTPSELIALLSGLCWSRWAPTTVHQSTTIAQMFRDLETNAYTAVRQGAIESDLNYYCRHIGPSFIPAPQKVLLARDAIHRFVATFSSRQLIDIHYGVNSPLIIKQGGVDLIDWLAASSFIYRWVAELTLTERMKVGTLRGLLFEEEVRLYLKRYLKGPAVFWPPRRKIRNQEKQMRDVDLAIILEDVMFLVECKIRLGLDIPVGKISVLERKEQWDASLTKSALTWLRQVDETADALARGRRTIDGHVLPRTIRFIVPLVCSPTVAYIPSHDPQYFLTSSIPRVCTPKELLKILTGDLSATLGCPAVLKLA
jgi:hypothetical protein